MSTSTDLRRIVGAMTKPSLDRNGLVVQAITIDSSSHTDALVTYANHADALVALVEAVEAIRPRLDHELHGAISRRHAEQIGALLNALAAVHAVRSEP